MLTDLYIESNTGPPAQIVLDLDTTDVSLHDHQPEPFSTGVPRTGPRPRVARLLRQLLLSAAVHLRRRSVALCAANQGAAAGSVEEVGRIVAQLRQRCSAVKIVLRADSRLCREGLMAWCESYHVDDLFGLARNQRLRTIIAKHMHQATSKIN